MRTLGNLLFLLTLTVAATSPAGADAAKPGASAAHSVPLPVSLLELMRASIEVPADGIWAAQAADKLSEQDWRLAELDSINLIVGASLIAHAGSGKNDAEKMAAPDFKAWTRELQNTALAIRAAVKAMDQKKMSAAADHLQEICEGCHTKYRPQVPSDGVARYPFYPTRELAK